MSTCGVFKIDMQMQQAYNFNIFVSGYRMPETDVIMMGLQSLEVVMDYQIDSIIYLSVSTDW